MMRCTDVYNTNIIYLYDAQAGKGSPIWRVCVYIYIVSELHYLILISAFAANIYNTASGRSDEGVFPHALSVHPPPPITASRVSMGWKSAAVVPTRTTTPALLFVPSVRACALAKCVITLYLYSSAAAVTTTTTATSKAADRGNDVSRPGPSPRRCQLWRNGFAGRTDGRGLVSASDLVATTLAPHVRHFVLLRTVAAAAVCRIDRLDIKFLAALPTYYYYYMFRSRAVDRFTTGRLS